MTFRKLLSGETQFLESYDDFIQIDEASFSASKIEKVVGLYAKILSRKMGGQFKQIGFEDYNRKMGKGRGLRLMNNDGHQLRFNWDSKLAKSTKYDLTSVDYWTPLNTNFQKPTRTVVFGPELNVVQVMEQIGDALLSGSINEAQEHLVDALCVLNEKRSGKEKQDWLASKGLPKSLAGSEKNMRARAEKEGLSEELEVFLGQPETNTFETELKKSEKKLSGEVFADPETVFEDIEDLLSVVAAGKWRTLVVCGQGGIGKTYHITEGPRSLEALLGPEGDKWTYHSGTKAAPYSFYKTLFQERDKIIVFDEADSILKNPDIIMMLKPILDTSGKNMAEYMSGTANMVGMDDREIEAYARDVDDQIAAGATIGIGKDDVMLPSKFKFTGGMIFISNMRAKQIEGAIMSRSIFIDVYLAQQDVLKRIKSIATAKYGADIAVELMEGLGQASAGPEVEVQYMTPEYARKTKPFTVRSMDLAYILKESGLTRWAQLAQLYA